MEFTGERFLPDLQGEIRLEHYHRYAIAADFVAGKRVLDIACGEGYGSFILSEFAESVVGVDISHQSVRHAQEKYAPQRGNLLFMEGSASDLNLSENQFDVVVSFETIEHLYEQEEMLSEIRRVLKPDGLLIISSPNKPVYSKNGGYENHFHLKELDYSEFDNLLKKQFNSIEYLGQRLQIGSVIQPLNIRNKFFRVWGDDGSSIKSFADPFPEPVYYLAFCAASIEYLPALYPSAIYPSQLDLLNQYQGYAAWATRVDEEINQARNFIAIKNQEHEEISSWGRNLEDELKLTKEANQELALQLKLTKEANQKNIEILNSEKIALQESIADANRQLQHLSAVIDQQNIEILNSEQIVLQESIADANRQIQDLNIEIVKRGEWAMGLKNDLINSREEISKILASYSWRLTKPLRAGNAYVRLFIEGVKRCPLKILTTLKQAYRQIPFSHSAKQEHKKIIGKYAPWILRMINVNPMTEFYKPIDVAYIPHLGEQDINFSLSTSHKPVVSIIIPIYGKIEFTVACLRSIAKNQPKIPYEVIVIDDCSPDNSFEILMKIEGIKVHKNKVNSGFIDSCNTGAFFSVGEYLYFLNNDTQVTPNWLDALHQTYFDFSNVGFVGSKLIYPDGRLQEAGGIIWQDGSAWNYGRNQDANTPEFNYAREVDFCSGASIMVPKKIFDELGGFDRHYMPAYCEDCDLALKIKNRGLKVMYQPLSTIIHFEGVTSGTDLQSGVKSYQVENMKKMYQRWSDSFKTHRPNGQEPLSEKDRSTSKRVLVLDLCTPTPKKDAGSLLTFNLLLLLRDFGFQVTFIPVDNFLHIPGDTELLQKHGIEVIYHPFFARLEDYLISNKHDFDFVFMFRPQVVDRSISLIRKYCPNAKVLFHTVDLHFLRLSRQAALEENKKMLSQSNEMKKIELNAIRNSDSTIVVSDVEARILEEEMPESNVHVLPLLLKEKKVTPPEFESRKNIIFVGSFQHDPNIDAAIYLANDIFPLVRNKLKEVRLIIVGANPPKEVQSLECEDIAILGYVEQLDDLFDQVMVSVAPLRFGAGVKGKIASSMSAGVPVVATSLASEGMGLVDGVDICIADSPKEFADAIERLYLDKSLWKEVSLNGIRTAQNLWGTKSIKRKLVHILNQLNVEVE